MENPPEKEQPQPSCAVCGRHIEDQLNRFWAVTLKRITHWLCSAWCLAKFEECPDLFRREREGLKASVHARAGE
jgi:hypothetical protein